MEGLTSFHQLRCGIQINMFETQALYQELVKMPSLKSRSMLVSGGPRLLNLVSVKSGNRRVAENSGPSTEGSLWADLKGLI